MFYMGNRYQAIKVLEKAKEKFKQLVRLESISLDRDVTFTEVLEDMMEQSFKKFDNATIERMKNH